MEGLAGGLGWRGWVKLLASGWLGWQVMPEDGRRILMQLVDQLLTTPAPDTKALPPPQVTPIAPITPSAELESTYTVSESKGPESLDDIIGRALLKLGAPLPPLHVPSSISDTPERPAEPDPRWRTAILHPSIVLILGKLGSGKSALAYFLMELFRYQLNLYVVGVPQGARNLLPPWVGMADTLEDVPGGSIAIVDEAYLRFHARGSMAAESKAMSQLLNLSRQRDLTVILVSPDARQVDINIASAASVIIVKEPGAMRLEFERREVRPILERAKDQFSIVRGDKRGWSYVYAPDVEFEGMLQNSLPSFWSPRLSKLFAQGQERSTARRPRRPSAEDRATEARRLDALGFSNGEIARKMGVSKASVVNYLRNYPYRRRSE